MKRKIMLAAAAVCAVMSLSATDYTMPGHRVDPNPFVRVSEENEKMLEGKFSPTWESLSQYEIPEWFKDAKFGIWAHWGPQCVEGTGDWMARSMYIEGSREYNWHVEHYGHPSECGFKDILPLFKAEKWDPQALVDFYKEVGAQYFMVLGNHHDNFDLWDSKYQPWNSKNIGPRRDILAEWSAAARKAGLPFGVSLHADHAWTWYEPARRYDLKGSLAGVSYDGIMTAADGKGKWWEGLDPQDLYVQRHPLSRGSWSNELVGTQWGWENGASIPSREFCTNFYDRTLDMINRYSPDLIYFDATALPLNPISDAGLKIAAHFYNDNLRRHNGRMEGVLFGKILTEEQKRMMVWDVERGAPNSIQPLAWQSCSCIGGWHYNTDIYNNDWYKSAPTVMRLLVDIVSKNGNLLLSVPLRADGTFDEKEEAILREFGSWFKTARKGILRSRPWRVFGEGPIAESDIKIKDQGFNEGEYAKATSRDIRYTTVDGKLYAYVLAWPEDRSVLMKALASAPDAERVKKVTMLGHGKVRFAQTDGGLSIVIPEKATETPVPVFEIELTRR